MADPINVTNSAAQLDGKTLVTAEDAQEISGQKIFKRAPAAPFDVEAGSARVTNLDADTLDGEEGSAYHNASNLNAGTIPGERLPDPLPAKSGENLTNLDAAALTGTVPGASIPDPLPAVDGSALTALPDPLPAVSGENLTDLDATKLDGVVPVASIPADYKEIQRGGALVNSNGITAGINVIVWRAPYACTVKNVRGYRVGGTGATVNARKNGSSNFLASALSLTSADTWMDGGTVQNAGLSAGDKVEIMVVSVAGDPTQVAVQIDLSVP